MPFASFFTLVFFAPRVVFNLFFGIKNQSAVLTGTLERSNCVIVWNKKIKKIKKVREEKQELGFVKMIITIK